MTTQPCFDVERYELAEDAAYWFPLSRREFIQTFGAGVVVLALAGSTDAQESAPREVGGWVHIGADGSISVFTGKTEVGQNIRTSLSQAVAEELRVSPEAIRMVMADTDRVPFDMGTFGSRTTPTMAPQLRKAAATAREFLLDKAAKEWGTGRETLVSSNGSVRDPASGRSATYGQLAKDEAVLKAVLTDTPFTAAEEWQVLGKSILKVNGRSFVTGSHRFTTDVAMPEMAVGKVLRPPSIGATLVSVDSSAVPKADATVVVEKNFAGVAAGSEEAAERALAALRPQWSTTAQPSDSELFQLLKASGTPPPESTKGSIEEGMAAADTRISAAYTVAYIAHAPLEPRAAVAQWENGKLTVHTGTQRPFGVKQELARAFGIPESRVRVIVPDTGSGYGGKHTGEVAVEAARLAKAAGKPVKLVWTREEEFKWAYFRPAGLIETASGTRKDGLLTAWEFRNYNSGGAGIQTMYEVPHQRVHFVRADSPLRQGSYRALASTANHFAREVHMDEIAVALGLDPLEFRLKNLKDPRLRAVFEAAAEAFGWGRVKAGNGRGSGMGGGLEKGGYVATFAEVSSGKDLRSVKVERVVTAFECGAVVNPEHLKNQVEGALVMGLGGALFEAVRFENGRVLNARFSRYRVPRFSDLPRIETVLLDRKDLRSAGAGECPIVGIAPAIANALFRATGKRLRSLPLLPQEAAG
ncbi:MAG TPA: molybdopterin cofactor-binding domain-containing protein [Bryobacteraceae bacterium]|nr:molybdopterin cofactor-binding domain-containing protein [Bryobacteraceae bacterium]